MRGQEAPPALAHAKRIHAPAPDTKAHRLQSAYRGAPEGNAGTRHQRIQPFTSRISVGPVMRGPRAACAWAGTRRISHCIAAAAVSGRA